MEPNNYGYAGLAITEIKLLQSLDNQMTEHMVKHDEQAQYVARTVVDLTEGIYRLGQLLRSDSDSRPLMNRTINHKKYVDRREAISYIKGKLGALCNYVLLIGETALELLETMIGHIHKTSEESPDEFALSAARSVYRAAADR